MKLSASLLLASGLASQSARAAEITGYLMDKLCVRNCLNKVRVSCFCLRRRVLMYNVTCSASHTSSRAALRLAVSVCNCNTICNMTFNVCNVTKYHHHQRHN